MFSRLHRRIVDLFSSRCPRVIFFLCVMQLALLGWIDAVTGDYSLIVFYLIPVSLATWFINKWCGALICVLSILVRLGADEAAGGFAFTRSMLHYWNELIEFIFLLIMSILFSTLKKNLTNEKIRAGRDPLTAALNRRSFFDLAEHELDRLRRHDLPFSLAYIDLDSFKEVNDRFGHRTGDTLLLAVVSAIHANIRSTDVLARFGGDEFVILLPETSGETSRLLLGKIHEQLNAVMKLNNWPVTFSIGAVTYLEAPSVIDEVINRADQLMHKVKNSGRNRLLHQEIREENNG